jgi:hypothetical protein
VVAQLCSQICVLPAQLKELYDSYSFGTQRATLIELQEILSNVVGAFGSVFIITDALDEGPTSRERAELLAMISALKSWSLPRLHLFVTSRREPDIEEALLPLLTIPAIAVEGSHVDLDIECHILWCLENSPKLKRWSPHLQSEIMKTLLAGANGM